MISRPTFQSLDSLIKLLITDFFSIFTFNPLSTQNLKQRFNFAIASYQSGKEGVNAIADLDGKNRSVGRYFTNLVTEKITIKLLKLIKLLDAALTPQTDLAYSSLFNGISADELTLQADLYEALARQEFSLHYQPQIEVATGRFLGVESLIRWQHPKFGWISPAQFIPIAEKNGLIINIGYWVLMQACTQYQNWMRQGISPFKLSVNLSARQLQQPDLVERIRGILQTTGMDASYLELEITESYKLLDLKAAINTLKDLHQLGIKIAIDDFGIGYSSLSFLKNFPIHTLKIDKSFLENLVITGKNWILLQNIIELGHQLNLKIVAEGVENNEQFNILKKMNCDSIQGYFISRPLDLEGITRYFNRKPEALNNGIF